ncbi:MAG TPA: zf-HC2 domain-containing protein [Acidimicrobiales bacterium]|nr:zf-HC2 domain-containing protein [Acidimicrobiales bacterium]
MSNACSAEFSSLLPAYVLDAVDDAERDLVRAHLHDCLRCALEVEELRASAAVIDDAQPEPSAELWPRIRDAIRSCDTEPVSYEDPAATPGGAGAAPVRTRHQARVAPASTSADVDLLRLTSKASHDLLWIQTPDEAAAIVARFVRALGADIVSENANDCIPIDISFGVGPPLFPASPRLSVTRMLVEDALPLVVEDARRAVALARERRRHNQ